MKIQLRYLFSSFALCLSLGLSYSAQAQLPVQANADHAKLLSSVDAKAAANKRVVYDFWREVLEAGHVELAEKYLTESFIEHNPVFPTGREAFVKALAKNAKPKTIEARIKKPIVAIVAEGDLVVFSFLEEHDDPKSKGKKYTTTWFDMFRIENGKIAQHWDNALKPEK